MIERNRDMTGQGSSSIEGSPQASQKNWWKPLVLILSVVALLILSKVFHLGDKLGELRGWIQSLGVWGPVVFIGLYVVATLAAIPGSALTLAAGAAFGSVQGVIFVSIASTLGAALAFLVSRYFARKAVESWLLKSPKFQRLDHLTAKQGAMMVALTRLVPIFPFNLLNYGFGLTRVPFWTYVFWSWLCMLPGTILYVAGSDALFKAFSTGRVPWPLVGAVVLAAVVLTLIVKKARGRLEENSNTEQEEV